jgi:hypothetical protein
MGCPPDAGVEDEENLAKQRHQNGPLIFAKRFRLHI